MTLGDDMSKIAKPELYALIAEAERWIDSVQPYREDMPEHQKTWRLGFAAAMQRIEMIATADSND